MSEAVSELVEVEEVDTDAPAGAAGYKIRLNTVDDIRVEMARVYREMRRKSIPMADGTKLVFVLAQLAQVARVVTIEQRMDALQTALEKAGIHYDQ
jgi:hypothetical protein